MKCKGVQSDVSQHPSDRESDRKSAGGANPRPAVINDADLFMFLEICHTPETKQVQFGNMKVLCMVVCTEGAWLRLELGGAGQRSRTATSTGG